MTLLGFITLYLIASIGIGIYAATRVKNTADYALAGRSLPLFVIVATTFATWFGSETVLGIPSKFVEGGFRNTVEDPFGAGLCLVLVGMFFARKLYNMELPRGIGIDVSGTVDAVGEGVTDVAVGDKVLGFADFAKYPSAGAADVAEHDHWAKVPPGLDMNLSAALPMAAIIGLAEVSRNDRPLATTNSAPRKKWYSPNCAAGQNSSAPVPNSTRPMTTAARYPKRRMNSDAGIANTK
jgi:hypothetical protein